MLLSRYLAGFKKQACDNSSLMKQLGFSPGTKWSPFPFCLSRDLLFKIQRKMLLWSWQLDKDSFLGKAQENADFPTDFYKSYEFFVLRNLL